MCETTERSMVSIIWKINFCWLGGIMSSSSLTEKSEKGQSYPRSALVLLFLNLLQASAFLVFLTTNVTFWVESLGEDEKYGNDANFMYGFLIHFTPLFTGFAADNFLGRYYTTMGHIAMFLIGFGCMTCAPLLSAALAPIIAWIGLFSIATAVGMNKAVVPTFNADQFTEEHSEESKNRMFAWYYMLVNVGGIIAIFCIGSLKDLISCFGKETCYPIMFASCLACIFLSGVIFVMMRKKFVKAPLSSNAVVESIKCVFVAIFNTGSQEKREKAGKDQSSEETEKISEEKTETGVSDSKTEVEPSLTTIAEMDGETGTFLDRAYPRYSRKFIADVLQVGRVGKMFFIGIPFFTCYNVMFGQWAFQFAQTNGQIGDFTINFLCYVNVNPIFCVLFIFFMNKMLFPMMKKCMKITYLRKMGAGGLAACVCYVSVILVQYKLDADAPSPLENGSQVYIWKQSLLEKCDFVLMDVTGRKFNFTEIVASKDIKPGKYNISSSCGLKFTENQKPTSWIEMKKGINIVAIYPDATGSEAEIFTRATDYEKMKMLRTRAEIITCRNSPVYLEGEKRDGEDKHTLTMNPYFFDKLNFDVNVGECSKSDKCLSFNVDIKGKLGAKIAYFDRTNCHNQTATPEPPMRLELLIPHSVHFSWMIPQAALFALAEGLLAVAALEFAYTQTSHSMKSVVQAMWLQTAAIGSLLGLALNQLNLSLLVAFYVYGAIMLGGTLLFIFAAMFYEYVDEPSTKKI